MFLQINLFEIIYVSKKTGVGRCGRTDAGN